MTKLPIAGNKVDANPVDPFESEIGVWSTRVLNLATGECTFLGQSNSAQEARELARNYRKSHLQTDKKES